MLPTCAPIYAFTRTVQSGVARVMQHCTLARSRNSDAEKITSKVNNYIKIQFYEN